MLDRSELAMRFPQFAAPDDHVGFFEPEGGVLRAEPAVAAFAGAAQRRGADLRCGERVVEWRADAGGVAVRTERGSHRGAQLILAAGPWTSRVANDLGVALSVTRQVMGWVAPPEPERFTPDVFPAWAIQNGDGSLHYGMPLLPGARGLKIAHHAAGTPADPDRVDRTPRPRDEADFRPALRRLLPDADGALVAMHVCLYTMSADSHFVIGRHPRHENVSVACGMSGHGFKFAPVIGEALADLATQGATRLPIGFLAPTRFAGGPGGG
jgi:sarcosine oxidase